MWPFFLLLTTTPGEISTPFPTISNLAVEWAIEGDSDLDATCEVRFRKAGATEGEWRSGMPLRRVPAGSSQGTNPVVSWENRFAGSLFDLDSGTEYEIELRLRDPDGGEATRTVRATTRPEPVAAADAPLRQGGPEDLKSVRPGEILELADGDYGAVRLLRDGEPGRPIVYRSRTGRAVFREIGLSDRKWVYLEGLTVLGPVRMDGTEHCVVRRCRIEGQYGIKAYLPGMRNGCLEDNVILGIQPWKPEIMGAGGDNAGEGIQLTGSGNVIRHNRVSGFRDCLSHLEDGSAGPQICNDWLNNEVSIGLDDGIEADFAWSHCRVMRNRITNCFVGISSQPGLGGPNYFVRNVLYNLAYSGFKLHRFSNGDVILHNTVMKAGDAFGNYTSEPFQRAVILNNLFLGGLPPSMTFGGYSPGRGRAVDVQKIGDDCVIDWNAYGLSGTPFEGKFRSKVFLALPQKDGEFEAHGIQVSPELFRGVPFPSDPARIYEAPGLIPALRSGVADNAMRIANINDDFEGDGPDRGALEAGLEAPVYGPRPE